MKKVAIIQARMSSKRLPGKVLMDLEGSPVLTHVINRATASATFDAVIVATSDDPSDDPIEERCERDGVLCFRGSLEDVLGRFAAAARAYDADVIGRLTADCPLLDPRVIKTVVESFDPTAYDYASNVITRTYPKGLDTEVFSRSALERANREATSTEDREHVTRYFYTHPELFRLRNVSQATDRSSLRWTLDTPEDWENIRSIYTRLGNRIFGQEEILAIL